VEPRIEIGSRLWPWVGGGEDGGELGFGEAEWCGVVGGVPDADLGGVDALGEQIGHTIELKLTNTADIAELHRTILTTREAMKNKARFKFVSRAKST
jgi:hypothetical protein